jgi:predicted small metal-binding protein
MTKVLRCMCGYTLRSENEVELIRVAQEHAMQVHGLRITAEQALAMSRPE